MRIDTSEREKECGRQGEIAQQQNDWRQSIARFAHFKCKIKPPMNGKPNKQRDQPQIGAMKKVLHKSRLEIQTPPSSFFSAQLEAEYSDTGSNTPRHK